MFSVPQNIGYLDKMAYVNSQSRSISWPKEEDFNPTAIEPAKIEDLKNKPLRDWTDEDCCLWANIRCIRFADIGQHRIAAANEGQDSNSITMYEVAAAFFDLDTEEKEWDGDLDHLGVFKYELWGLRNNKPHAFAPLEAIDVTYDAFEDFKNEHKLEPIDVLKKRFLISTYHHPHKYRLFFGPIRYCCNCMKRDEEEKDFYWHSQDTWQQFHPNCVRFQLPVVEYDFSEQFKTSELELRVEDCAGCDPNLHKTLALVKQILSRKLDHYKSISFTCTPVMQYDFQTLFPQVLQQCCNLQSLTLQTLNDRTPVFSEWLDAVPPSATCLSLSKSYFSAGNADKLAKLVNIKDISFKAIPASQVPLVIESIKSLKSLEKITFESLNVCMDLLLETICSLPQLINLNLSSCKIEDHNSDRLFLALAFGKLKLKTLSLSSNYVKTIPIEFQLKPWSEMGLEQLHLSGNPITSPPSHVAEESAKLRDYFLDLQHDSARVEKVRLYVVGFGGSGKTTLQTALRASDRVETLENFQEELRSNIQKHVKDWPGEKVLAWCEERVLSRAVLSAFGTRVSGKRLASYYDTIKKDGASAHSIEQEELKNLPEAEKEVLRKEVLLLFEATKYVSTAGASHAKWGAKFEVVDMAGQVEYYVSHHLFLNGLNSFFIVVAPLIDEHGEVIKPPPAGYGSTRAFVWQWDYWLRFLSSLTLEGGRVPVFLVATHVDRMGNSSQHRRLRDQLQLEARKQSRAYETSVLVNHSISEMSIRLRVSPRCYLADYSPQKIDSSLKELKKALEAELEAFSKTAVIPGSYLKAEQIVESLIAKHNKNFNNERTEKDEKDPGAAVLGQEEEEEGDGFIPILPLQKLQTSLKEADDRFDKDTELLDRAIDYVQSTGSILVDKAHSLVVFNPISFLAKVLTLFIRDQDCLALSFDENGSATFSEISDLLQSRNFSSSDTESQQILDLLVGFTLCCSLPQQRYLFPSQLPSLLPTSSLSSSSTALSAQQYHQTYDILDKMFLDWSKEIRTRPQSRLFGMRLKASPDSMIPPGFFVSIQSSLINLKYDQQQSTLPPILELKLWKNSVLLRHENTVFLMFVNPFDGSIEIKQCSSQKPPEDDPDFSSEYFASLFFNINQRVPWPINHLRVLLHLRAHRFPGFSFEEFILCPSCLGANRFPCCFKPQTSAQLKEFAQRCFGRLENKEVRVDTSDLQSPWPEQHLFVCSSDRSVQNTRDVLYGVPLSPTEQKQASTEILKPEDIAAEKSNRSSSDPVHEILETKDSLSVSFLLRKDLPTVPIFLRKNLLTLPSALNVNPVLVIHANDAKERELLVDPFSVVLNSLCEDVLGSNIVYNQHYATPLQNCCYFSSHIVVLLSPRFFDTIQKQVLLNLLSLIRARNYLASRDGWKKLYPALQPATFYPLLVNFGNLTTTELQQGQELPPELFANKEFLFSVKESSAHGTPAEDSVLLSLLSSLLPRLLPQQSTSPSSLSVDLQQRLKKAAILLQQLRKGNDLNERLEQIHNRLDTIHKTTSSIQITQLEMHEEVKVVSKKIDSIAEKLDRLSKAFDLHQKQAALFFDSQYKKNALPRCFMVVPEKQTLKDMLSVDYWIKNTFRLRLLCTHSANPAFWHFLEPSASTSFRGFGDDKGGYVVSMLKENVRKFGPSIVVLFKLFAFVSANVPLPGAAAIEKLTDAFGDHIKTALDFVPFGSALSGLALDQIGNIFDDLQKNVVESIQTAMSQEADLNQPSSLQQQGNIQQLEEDSQALSDFEDFLRQQEEQQHLKFGGLRLVKLNQDQKETIEIIVVPDEPEEQKEHKVTKEYHRPQGSWIWCCPHHAQQLTDPTTLDPTSAKTQPLSKTAKVTKPSTHNSATNENEQVNFSCTCEIQ